MSTRRFHDLFDRLLAGEKPGDLAEELQAADSPAAAATVAWEEDEDEALALLLLPQVTTPAPGRSRLLGLLTPLNRFTPHLSTLVELLRLPLETVADLVSRIDAEESWEAGPFPGLSLYHLPRSPELQDCIVGFVKLGAGLPFPEHDHHGEEIVMVVQGTIHDSGGRSLGIGEICRMPEGTSHQFSAGAQCDLVYLAIVRNGISVGGHFIGPDDPSM